MFSTMTRVNRGRPRWGCHCMYRYVLRIPLMAALAWVSMAFVSVSLPRVLAESSSPHVEAKLSLPQSSDPAGTLCWKTQGQYERDCFHDEPLTAETYPLTLGMLERASSRYTTTDLGTHRAFQRARKRGVLKVMVVGGSVTVGHQCVSPAGLDGKDCAWPNRLQQWCNERLQDVTVEIINAARPGCTILDLLHNYLLQTLPVNMELDLIIVDFGVNDAVLEHVGMDINNVKLAHEVFIRYVRNDMIDMPTLLYAETFIPPARLASAPLQGSNMAEVHAAVTMKYDIPMVSFRDVVWPDQNDSALASRIWGSAVHPDWQVHQLIADVLVYFIEKSYARLLKEYGPLSNPSPQEKAVSLYEAKLGCMANERSFIFNSRTFVGQPPPEEQVESIGWSFSKDKSGKGGLIGFGNSSTNATVSFDLPCAGERGILDIGYLRSYTGMGAVRVVVRGADAGPGDKVDGMVVVVDGLWEAQASIVDNVAIAIPIGVGTIRVTLLVISAETEAIYDRFLSHVTGSEADTVRIDRMFKVTSMQCC